VYVQFVELGEHVGGAVLAVSRPYALAAAVLAATGAVVVTPAPTRQVPTPTRSFETKLVDADSVLNIPINLFDDILNIPSNEIQGLDIGAGSLFNTGTWWVPGATNVWGVDTGDTTHVAGILGFLPFPALNDGVGGLAYQIDGLLAAELPTSASCDAATCAPITPPEVITGSSSIDRLLGFVETGTGQQEFGLFDNWFRVPISDLINGYKFDGPGVVDPSGPTTQGFGFPLDGGSNPLEGGTHPDPVVEGQNDFPWDGLTYHLNLLQPFENFYESLLQPVTGGIDGTGVDLPDLTDLTHALENGAAGLVIDFDPFTAGSPACPALCDIPSDEQIPAIVQDIANLDPSNTTIPAWLSEYAAGTADEPTQSQVYEAIALLQTGEYNLTPAELATVDTDLASINPELPALYTNAGIITDPGYLAYTEATANTTTGATTTAVFDPVYGGDNTNLVAQDLLTLLTNNETNAGALSETGPLLSLIAPGLIVSDPSAFAASAADAGSSAGSSATDLSNLANLDPSLSTDLSTLLASLGTTAGADTLSQLVSELSAQFTADLGAMVPQTLLSLF
jgi:hypothetical protein